MRVSCSHEGIADLASDLAKIPPTAVKDMSKIVRDGIRIGNGIAKAYATKSAGHHGIHYPKAFTAEMTGALSGVYGPEEGRMQGGMSFEHGSRNQPPHFDLAKSADQIGPALVGETREAMDRWFWPR